MFSITNRKGWLCHPFFYTLVAVGLVLVAYLNVLSVPFYFDDSVTLYSRSFDNVWQELWLPTSRSVADIIFLVQRQMFEDSPWGYHLVSLLLHCGIFSTALFCAQRWLVSAGDISTDAVKTKNTLLFFSFMTVWALLPLNSQAVIYVAQQYVLWCALFSLLSFFAFVRSLQGDKKLLYFAVSFVLWLAAFKSKQTALFLPLVHIAYGLLFTNLVSSFLRRSLLLYALLVVAGIVVALQIPFLDNLTRETLDVSRVEYLKAQSVILWQYWGLVFWPEPLVLDYGLRENVFSPAQIYLHTAAHVVVLGFAIVIARKLPYLTLAILSFYFLHLVESGFIPIQDFKLEHRMYVPTLFFWLFASKQLVAWARAFGQVPLVTLCVIIAMVQLFLVYQRVDQWNEPEAFYKAELENSHNEFWRAKNQLGVLYLERQDYESAAELFTNLLQDQSVPNNEALLLNAIAAFSGLERWSIVERLEQMIIPHFSKLTPINKSRLLINRAIRLAAKGDCGAALQFYEESKRYSEYTESHAIQLPTCAN